MKYNLFIMASRNSGACSEVLSFNCEEERNKAKERFDNSSHPDMVIEFQEGIPSVHQIFMELLKSDPLSLPKDLYSRAEEAFALMNGNE